MNANTLNLKPRGRFQGVGEVFRFNWPRYLAAALVIGGTLFAAFQRFDYDFVCAILIAIITLIMIGEVLATAVRAIFIENATLFDLVRRRGTMRRVRHTEDD